MVNAYHAHLHRVVMGSVIMGIHLHAIHSTHTPARVCRGYMRGYIYGGYIRGANGYTPAPYTPVQVLPARSGRR